MSQACTSIGHSYYIIMLLPVIIWYYAQPVQLVCCLTDRWSVLGDESLTVSKWHVDYQDSILVKFLRFTSDKSAARQAKWAAIHSGKQYIAHSVPGRRGYGWFNEKSRLSSFCITIMFQRGQKSCKAVSESLFMFINSENSLWSPLLLISDAHLLSGRL